MAGSETGAIAKNLDVRIKLKRVRHLYAVDIVRHDQLVRLHRGDEGGGSLKPPAREELVRRASLNGLAKNSRRDDVTPLLTKVGT